MTVHLPRIAVTMGDPAGVGPEVFLKAEALLDELRPESPLRHRLETELEEMRGIHATKSS